MSEEMNQTSSEEVVNDDAKPALEPKEIKKAEKPKKKHKALKIFGIAFGSLILILVLFAGWLGFVPGLSNLMGARTPKDLGVSWTEADFESYKVKTGTTLYDFADAHENPDKPGKKTVFADPKTVQDLQLTQEEITAAINNLGWSWLPATNVQVRLSNDTVEVSGNLKLDHVEEFINFIGGVGYSESDVSKAVDYGRTMAQGASFYAKGNASVTNNQLSFDLQKIQIGRLSVPMDVSSNVINTGGSNSINNAKHLDVQSATVGDGALNFTGTYPTTIYVKR